MKKKKKKGFQIFKSKHYDSSAHNNHDIEGQGIVITQQNHNKIK